MRFKHSLRLMLDPRALEAEQDRRIAREFAWKVAIDACDDRIPDDILKDEVERALSDKGIFQPNDGRYLAALKSALIDIMPGIDWSFRQKPGVLEGAKRR
ncbi:MAG: hypothetical protein KGH52_00695 [Candidatus Micrarchaeota archaeon]|nr:hypothetical protein [Candidatus Micrarchaeota archaeon]